MKIYFGEVSAQDLAEFGTDGALERNGRYFWGGVEYGTNPGGFEDVVIYDACGRSIPISVNHARQLMSALGDCLSYYNTLTEAETLEKELLDEANYGVATADGRIEY